MMKPTEQFNQELYHYGVKGMKWGVRKSEYKSMSKADRKKTRQDYKADKKWKRKTFTGKNYWKTYDKTRPAFDAKMIKEFERTTTLSDVNLKKLESKSHKLWSKMLSESFESVVNSPVSPSGKYRVEMLVDRGDFDAPYMSLVDNKTGKSLAKRNY